MTTANKYRKDPAQQQSDLVTNQRDLQGDARSNERKHVQNRSHKANRLDGWVSNRVMCKGHARKIMNAGVGAYSADYFLSCCLGTSGMRAISKKKMQTTAFLHTKFYGLQLLALF
jgi:hypothetical protein